VTLPDAVRLPFHFDAAALAAEALAIGADEWRPHFNRACYEGDWSGAALRVTDPRRPLFSDPSPDAKYDDAPLLERCPNVRSALGTFQCDLKSVRFLRLGPNSKILEHTDYHPGFEGGEVRMHVPITSDAGVDFRLAGERLGLQPGECWYLNVNQPHSVTNAGSTARIHLVIDCLVNAWLRELLVTTARAQSQGAGR